MTIHLPMFLASQYMKYADRILALDKDGKQLFYGTYDELRGREDVFAVLTASIGEKEGGGEGVGGAIEVLIDMLEGEGEGDEEGGGDDEGDTEGNSDLSDSIRDPLYDPSSSPSRDPSVSEAGGLEGVGDDIPHPTAMKPNESISMSVATSWLGAESKTEESKDNEVEAVSCRPRENSAGATGKAGRGRRHSTAKKSLHYDITLSSRGGARGARGAGPGRKIGEDVSVMPSIESSSGNSSGTASWMSACVVRVKSLFVATKQSRPYNVAVKGGAAAVVDEESGENDQSRTNDADGRRSGHCGKNNTDMSGRSLKNGSEGSRRNQGVSGGSAHSEKNDSAKAPMPRFVSQIIVSEDKAEGRLSASIWLQYLKAGASLTGAIQGPYRGHTGAIQGA